MLAPRENVTLFGHEEAKALFLKAFHSARFPHAWILGGNVGIGKATFAFHMARYILSGRQEGDTHFSAHDPLCRRILAQSHGDLWTGGGEGEPEIGVDLIRDLTSFLTQTPAMGGWRVVIIDGADRLNRNASNALLKRLEEPPPKTIFFLTTPLPARLLPTLRSRCQLLPLSPLSDQEVKDVLSSQGIAPPDFFALAEGSPGRLATLMEGEGPHIYAGLQKILEGASPTSFINTFGGEEVSYALTEDLLRTFLYKGLVEKLGKDASVISRALETYEKIDRLFDNCRFAQLDKRATLTCALASLQNSCFFQKTR